MAKRNSFVNKQIYKRNLTYAILLTLIITLPSIFFVGYYVARASYPSGATPVFEHPIGPYSYLLWTDGSTYYARNGSVGTIDSGAVASTVLNNALTSTENADTKRLIVLGGTYPISATINIAQSNITLEGVGSSTIFYASDGLNSDVISVGNDTGSYANIVLRNFRIEGNSAGQTGASHYAILFRNVHNSTIQTVWIHDADDDSIKIGSEVGDGSTENTIKNTHIWGYSSADSYTVADGIDLDFSDNNTIINNFISAGNLTPYHDGIDLGQGSSDNLIQGNRIDLCSGYGIYGDGSSDDNLVQNNRVSRSNQSGIGFVNTEGNQVTSNKVKYSGEHGIIISNGNYSLVENNEVRIAGTTGAGAGIRVTGSHDVTVSGNEIFDDQASPTMQYGIFFATTENSTVNDNNAFGAIYEGLSMSGGLNNIVSVNHFDRNGRHGLDIMATTNQTIVSINFANNNTNDGIRLYGNYNILSSSSAFGNGDLNIREAGANNQVNLCYNGTTWIP